MKIVIVFTPENRQAIGEPSSQTDEAFALNEVNAIKEKLSPFGEVSIEPDGPDLLLRLEKHKKQADAKAPKGFFVFNLSYGKFGNARYTHLPALLESEGIRYTGNSPLPHAVCLDKSITKILAQQIGVKTAPSVVFDRSKLYVANDFINNSQAEQFILKPIDDAGSLGVVEIDKQSSLDDLLKENASYLLEEKLVGEEVHQSYVPGLALPGVKINLSPGQLYTEKVKESANESLYTSIDAATQEKCDIAIKKIVKALSIDGYCRADLMLVNGEVYLIEVNSHASLKEKGALRCAAAMVGISEKKLWQALLDTAYKNKLTATGEMCQYCEEHPVVIERLDEGAYVSRCSGAIQGECTSPFLHDPVSSPRDCYHCY